MENTENKNDVEVEKVNSTEETVEQKSTEVQKNESITGNIDKKTEEAKPSETDESKDIEFDVSVACNDKETVTKFFEKLNDLDEDSEEFSELIEYVQNIMLSPTSDTAAEAIQEHVLDKASSITPTKLMRNRKWTGGNIVSGTNAKLAFAARNKGFYKLPLYNSGFYVLLRSPTSGELNALFEEIDDLETSRIGRIIGDLQFLCYDVYFKEAVMRILPSLVVGSNLENYNKSNVLLNAISFHDYDPILWAISAMLIDRKISIQLNCLECKHKEVVDYDYSGFHLIVNCPLEAQELVNKETVNKVDLKEYKKILYADSKENFDWDDIRIQREVPSLFEVVQQGKYIISAVEDKLGEEVTPENTNAVQELMFMFNDNLIPWIKSISQLDEHRNIEFATTDKKTFVEILNMLGLGTNHKQLVTSMTEYIFSTKASVIGYKPIDCPNAKCGASQAKDKPYIAWDPEKAFFTIAYRILNNYLSVE